MISWLIDFAISLCLALFLRLFVLSFARVKGSSMLNTLRDRDFVLVWRLGYCVHAPRRQDVVICHYPGRWMKRCKWWPQAFVKRVIGLPGDTIEFAEGEIRINGDVLSEPYLDPARCRYLRERPAFTLGEDEYFVMGDNRDRSNDSRSIGPIHRKDIRGHVVCVLLPLRRVRSVR